MTFVPYEPGARLPDQSVMDRWNDSERGAAQRYLRLHLARRSPLDFALITDPDAIDLPHSRFLSDHLQALVENRLYPQGTCPHEAFPDMESIWRHPSDRECHVASGERLLHNLVITAPPRHGKSWMVSKNLPAWYLARWPKRRVGLASYEADFAATWGQAAQDAFMVLAPDLGLSLDKRNTAKDDWRLLAPMRGGMTTAGVGGPLTGKGFNLLIADDLIKNSEEANSSVERENRWNWVVSTFFSRREAVIENKLPVARAKTVVMHTRWNEDDPVGRIEARLKHEWFFIDMPAIALEDDQLGREVGEPLCTLLHPLSELEESRVGDPFWFEAMYQGRPTPEGMGLFSRKQFRFWRPSDPNRGYNEQVPLRDSLFLMAPDGGYIAVPVRQLQSFVTVDLAASTRTSADFTVFGQWAVTPPVGPYERPALVLLRLLRERMESAVHMRRLREWVADGYPNIKIQYVAIEKATYGLTLLQQYKRARGMPPARELKADLDKVSRAIPVGALAADNRLYIPAQWPEGEKWISEHTVFPNGTNDDQVDVTAYAGICVQQWHDYYLPRDEDGRTPLPAGVEAGHTVEERYRRHLASKLRGSNAGRAAKNRL